MRACVWVCERETETECVCVRACVRACVCVCVLYCVALWRGVACVVLVVVCVMTENKMTIYNLSSTKSPLTIKSVQPFLPPLFVDLLWYAQSYAAASIIVLN